MQPKIKDGAGVYGRNKDVLGGFLQDNPDIYYFGFSSFMLSNNYMMSFRDEYLAIDEQHQITTPIRKCLWKVFRTVFQ